MARKRHPNKEIEAVVDDAVRSGWTLEKGTGHAWGFLLCAQNDRDGCMWPVWSTPKNPGNFARQLGRRVAKCAHQQDADALKEDDDAGA